MARFIRTIKINFRQKEAWEFERDMLVGRRVHGAELVSLGLGLSLIIFGILFLNGINPLNASGNGWVPTVIGGIWCSAHIAKIGLRMVTRRLISEGDLYDRLNIDYRTLNTIFQERDVQPKVIVNGKRYYTRSDFAEIDTLLRASIAPRQAGAETLLRAAREQSQISAEHLLRSVVDAQTPRTPATIVPAVPDQPQSLQSNSGNTLAS